ncbi:MAG TPA: tetraacyldisaccharide 4'-kinase, partial [Flavisolibacter sp.]|nr:tetraacyldisaccharide 4'-kinase [Flavisolibacter sp.]
LDDAFQHRAIAAGFNILLTDYGNLFTRDFFLPTGDLRDIRGNYKRADVIVVTKCPPHLPEEERQELIKEIAPLKHQSVYFSSISYGTPYHITNRNFYFLDDQTEVLLITGIANPKPLKTYLEERIQTYSMMHYTDHHIFTIDDWRDIKKRFQGMESPKKILLTTEKDAMRLLKFTEEITGMPFYVIPIEPKFLFHQGTDFMGKVVHFIDNFKQSN